MLGSRHLGYFFIHTVKPIIEEIDKVLDKCRNIEIKGTDMKWLIEKVVMLEVNKSIIYAICYVICGGMFCLIVWLILRG